MGYDIRDLMQLILAERGTGVHLYVGAAPVLEISRQLHRVEGPPLTKDEPQRMLRDIASADEMWELESSGLVSFDHEFTSREYFHVMAFRETEHVRLELRRFVDDDEKDAA
jgi:Tfp pilus assembly pilus retraction ATPase PilT